MTREEIRQAAREAVARAKGAAADVREAQRWQRQQERKQAAAAPRETAAERRSRERQEADNEIPPELWKAWEAHGDNFKGTPHRRVELFLEWVEAEPGEVAAVTHGGASDTDAQFQQEQREQWVEDTAREVERESLRAQDEAAFVAELLSYDGADDDQAARNLEDARRALERIQDHSSYAAQALDNLRRELGKSHEAVEDAGQFATAAKIAHTSSRQNVKRLEKNVYARFGAATPERKRRRA